VTGGAGFIGSALVHRLVKDGHEVTVLDRFSRGKMERLPKPWRLADERSGISWRRGGVAAVEADIRDPEPVEMAVADADVVWHLAYVQGTQTFYADPKDVIDVALTGIMNVLHACEKHPGKDLILVSSSEVYQDPPAGMFPTDESVPLSVPDVTNPRYSYGGGKIASELAVLAYAQAGLLGRAVIVRPHNVYGPDMGHEHVIPEFAARMNAIRRSAIVRVNGARVPDEFRIQGTGQETRSFCHIDDCVDGLIIAGTDGEDRGVYHLGNPREEYAIGVLAYMIADLYGVEIDLVPGALPEGSPTRRLPDTRKLEALGFDPKVSLEDGLPGTLEWYAENPKVAA
jgi:nucleoside-diphosphate-sugar epimerase